MDITLVVATKFLIVSEDDGQIFREPYDTYAEAEASLDDYCGTGEAKDDLNDDLIIIEISAEAAAASVDEGYVDTDDRAIRSAMAKAPRTR